MKIIKGVLLFYNENYEHAQRHGYGQADKIDTRERSVAQHVTESSSYYGSYHSLVVYIIEGVSGTTMIMPWTIIDSDTKNKECEVRNSWSRTILSGIGRYYFD